MAIINSGTGFFIGRQLDIQLSAELRHKGDPIFERQFIGDSRAIVDIVNNRIKIPNHFFKTGEKLDYQFPNFENATETDSRAIGIGTTNIVNVGITSRLPRTLFAIVEDSQFIKVAETKEKALRRNPECLNLTRVGAGSSHKFIGEKQNTRSLITIDNVVQTPTIDTEIITELSEDLSGASDVVFTTGITSFFTGDLLRIDSEIMRIELIGLGNTDAFLVRRPVLGTSLADHAIGSKVVKLTGNYQIVDNIIYFPVAPFERSPTTDLTRTDPTDRDYVGLETFSTFNGRVFLRSGFENTEVGPYDRNFLLDDISSQFLGISTQAVLRQEGENIAGFSTGNALVLINNVIQTPDFIDFGLGESSGITTISFTGEQNPNLNDINTASVPRGGIVISVGTNEGYGYQPLVAAGGTANVSTAGTISEISIGYTGSGYRSSDVTILQTRINSKTELGGGEFFLENTEGLFEKLNFYINGSPQAKAILSVQDSVGVDRESTLDATRITSIGSGNTSVIIADATQAWQEVTAKSSYKFFKDTVIVEPSGISTDVIEVFTTSGISTDVGNPDYFLSIDEVATNILIIGVDDVNNTFKLNSNTSSGYEDGLAVTISTFQAGITSTTIGDNAYITISNPNLGIANIYANTLKVFDATRADYTHTTGIVTITAPGFDVQNGDIVDLRNFKYSCNSGGSLEGSSGSTNQRFNLNTVTFDLDGGSGIATITEDSDQTTGLSPGDLVLIGNTSEPILDDKIFTVVNSPVSFGGNTNAFEIDIETTPPASNITSSPGFFVLATVLLPSGVAGYEFKVIDVLPEVDKTFVLDVGKTKRPHTYIGGGKVKNITQSKKPVHIGIATISNGSLKDPIITNTGIGFTQYDIVKTLILSNTAIGDTTFIEVDNVIGIDLIKDYVSFPDEDETFDYNKIISVDNTVTPNIINLQKTVKIPSASGNVLSGKPVNILRFDDYFLDIDDPLSYNNLSLVYSNSSVLGVGTRARADIVVGNDAKIESFELTQSGYSYGQGEILTIPTQGPTGIPTFTSFQTLGITTAVGILTGSLSTDSTDQFGFRVANNSDGTRIIVGAPFDNLNESEDNSGIVYAFDRSGNTFSQVGILTGEFASDLDDQFGYSIAVSANGERIVVGSPSDTGNVGSGGGLVYLFDRSAGPTFTQVGILTGLYSTDPADGFGWSVDISNDGNIIVVGARGDENPGNGSGSGVVYVYERDDGPPISFSQVGILTGSFASDATDFFGYDVAISGDGEWITVGAVDDEDNTSGSGSYGVVYIFNKDGFTINQVGILTSPKLVSVKTNSDNFGYSVDVNFDGKIVIVGANDDTTSIGGNKTGLVYVFERIDGEYYLIQTLRGTYANDEGDNFGETVSISDDGSLISVGALNDELPGTIESSGIVYVYERRTFNYLGSDYIEVGIKTSNYNDDNITADNFGNSVSLSGDGNNLIVGSKFDGNSSAGIGTSGSVYVYDLNKGSIFEEFQVLIDRTFTDDFSGYVFGDLVVFDDISRLFNGSRFEFPIRLNGKSTTLRSRPGSPIELEYNLIILINDIYQVPNQSYVFNGGSSINFLEPPKEGDKCVIMFYFGTTEVDTQAVNILETIKPGDTVQLNSEDINLQQDFRSVTEIKSTEVIQTNSYISPGLTDDEQLLRPVVWCKQLVDKVINGEVVGKSRVPYEPEIYPQSNIIKSVGIGSTERFVFVESVKTFFDSNDEYEDIGVNKKPQNQVRIIDKGIGVGATASISIDINNLTVQTVTLESEGFGYFKNPNVYISAPNATGIGTTGETAEAQASISRDGKVVSLTLTNPGYGYTNSPSPYILIDSPPIKYDVYSNVFYEGDFGVVTGIGTTSSPSEPIVEVGFTTGIYASDVSDNFGFSIDTNILGTSFVVGSPNDEFVGSANTGLAYVYDYDLVTEQIIGIATLSQGNPYGVLDTNEQYGYAVAMSGSGLNVAVSSPQDELSGATNNGVLYIYERIGDNFIERNKFGDESFEVGILSKSLEFSGDGNFVFAGCPNENSNTGKVFIYKRDPVGLQTFIPYGNVIGSPGAFFGISVASNLNGNTLVVGSSGENSIYVYNENSLSDTFELNLKIEEPIIGNEKGFGSSVDISSNGETLVVSDGGFSDSQNVYVYDFNFVSGNWDLSDTIVLPEPSIFINVSITENGRNILVGAPRASTSGESYLYKRNGSSYVLKETLTGSQSSATSVDFGSSASICDTGEVIAVGADSSEISASGADSGISYIFKNPTPNAFEKSFVFELYIPENSYLRNETITNKIDKSGIIEGYYFKLSNTGIGSTSVGTNSLNIYNGSEIFRGDGFLDGVYQVSNVSVATTEVYSLNPAPGFAGIARTEVVRVICPVESWNNLDIPSGGIIGNVSGDPAAGLAYTYNGYFGDYSWGRISDFDRDFSNTFELYKNGEQGISTSAQIVRINPLKFDGYTPNT